MSHVSSSYGQSVFKPNQWLHVTTMITNFICIKSSVIMLSMFRMGCTKQYVFWHEDPSTEEWKQWRRISWSHSTLYLILRDVESCGAWAHLCWFKAKSCLLQYFCPFRASTQKSAEVCMVPWLEENTSASGYAYLTYIDCDEASFARLDQYLGPWQRAWQGQPMHWCWQWAIRRPCKIQQ